MPQTRSQGRAAGLDSPHLLLDVPDNVLQNILQRLTLQQRLAPVCTRWLSVGRRCPIDVAGLDYNRLESLLGYLQDYGHEVSSMRLAAEVDGDDLDSMLQLETDALRCSNLRDLELYQFRLERSAETNAGVLSAATGLTRLVMVTAMFTPSYMHIYSWKDAGQPDPTAAELAAAVAAAKAEAAASFENIQQLTSLQALLLARMYAEVQLPQEDDSGVYTILYDPLNIPGEGLAALTQLTKLSLFAAIANPRDTLQHISRLQHLQDLQLAALLPTGPEDEPPQLDDPAAADMFAGIGTLQHLTSLSVFNVPGMLTRQYLQGPGAQHQISALTAMQRLQLDDVVFEPALLVGMTQLTCLELSDITWILESQDSPAGPVAGQPPPIYGLPAYKLLLLLPRLKQLRHLVLDIDTWPEAEYQLPTYSALTANTNLEHLDLQQYEYPLPATAWKHIFRKELQLPGIAGVMFQGIAPRTSEDRVLHCCPVVAAGMMEGRLREGILELRCLDEEEGVSPEELRLLEVNTDDPPGVPAVLGALTHLEVVFSGAYHGWGVHGCSEAEFQEGNFGMKQKRGGTIW